jgi:hypothetical protein
MERAFQKDLSEAYSDKAPETFRCGAATSAAAPVRPSLYPSEVDRLPANPVQYDQTHAS